MEGFPPDSQKPVAVVGGMFSCSNTLTVDITSEKTRHVYDRRFPDVTNQVGPARTPMIKFFFTWPSNSVKTQTV